jgi:hypothetical protein
MSRKAIGGGLLAAALLALAGCGGEDAAPPEDPVGEAAARATEAGSSRVAYEASFLTEEGSFSFEGEGELDYEARRARMVYDMAELPGAFAPEIEARLDGRIVYLRIPAGAEGIELPEGREWLRLDVARLDPTELGVAAVHQDPALFLRYLQRGATDVTEEGTEVIRGEETTIYTAVLDLDRLLEEGFDDLGADEREAARAELERVRQQLASPAIPVTVNVDGDGRLRRILITLELHGESPATVLTTTDFFDFGVDVDVAPPPDELVFRPEAPPDS